MDEIVNCIQKDAILNNIPNRTQYPSGEQMKNALMILLLLLAIPQGFAMRCQQALVDEGDPVFSLIQKCGEPLFKETRTIPTTIFNVYGQPIGQQLITVEVWIYQFSSNDFQYTVYIDNGLIKQIEASRNP